MEAELNSGSHVKDISNFEGVYQFFPGRHKDLRGENVFTFEKNIYEQLLGVEFVKDEMSISKKNVIRGLHGDNKTGKLIQVLYGEVFFVIVDYRKESKTYLQHKHFLLNSTNRLQIYIPPNFLNGHMCLSEECIFSYKMTQYYNGIEDQYSIRYDDEKIDIKWPLYIKPILSYRDSFAKN
jgi:dTDP-4-dehydrorhamnose 3,5-epimerase